MIEEIRIRDLGVIADATLPLGPGLTAVTGETGAGKTMVVTALGLLLGDRADGGVVRAGADAAVPGVAVIDTLRLRSGEVLDVTRDDLVAVQTPQAFGAEVLRRVHADEADATDDASLVDAAGGSVVVVPGDPLNRKITDPVDLLIADVLALSSERS